VAATGAGMKRFLAQAFILLLPPLIAVPFPFRMAGSQSARISSLREFIAFRTLSSMVCT
jgi:hypothetical protein